MIERKDRNQKKVVCCLLFVLLLPSVSPLSMSESSLPLSIIGVPVGKSVLARILFQVRRILSLIFSPCDQATHIILINNTWCSSRSIFSPVALLKYLPLPSLNPATQSPSYLVIIMSKMGVTKVTLVITTMLCVGDQVDGTP